jgi:putative Ca2+/H+ antiporter (TMEM165/GDT1 family)
LATGHKFSPAPTEDPSASPRPQEQPVSPPPVPAEPESDPESPKPVSNGPKKPESSRFGKQCLKIFKIFVNAFGVIFLAEWGDRSQLATIVLVPILLNSFCSSLAMLQS